MSEGPSQLDSLLDSVGVWFFNIYDAYGWYVPALFLTVLFFAALALLCYAMEDFPIEPCIFRAPKAIFTWTKKQWRQEKE